MFQEIVVCSLIIVAVCYLIYRLKRKFSTASSGCDSCAFSNDVNEKKQSIKAK